MKSFITHTTENYEHVTLNLAKSIQRYSDYPLTVYTIDYDASAELKKLATCRRLDLNLPLAVDNDFVDHNGIMYVNRQTYRTYATLTAKIEAMIQAVDDGIKEWVYMDADCVANLNVDDMFDFVEQVGDYPLATLGPQQFALLVDGNDNFIGNPFWKEDGSTDITACLEWPLMQFFGMKEEQRSLNYRTTNILVGNDQVKPFLTLWKDLKNTLPQMCDLNKYLPFHEETLYNVLVWQRDDKGLPMVYINITGAETVEHFLEADTTEDKLLTRFYRLPADKQKIKVFHGEKRSEEIDKIFNILGEKETPLKILFLAPHLSTGGMPAFLLKRIEMLQKWTNHEIFVAEWTLYSGAYTVQRDKILSIIPEDHFISLGHLGEDEETHFNNRVKIVEKCYEWGIDVIHIDEAPEGFDSFSQFPAKLQEHLYHTDHPWRIVETCHNIWFKPKEMKRFLPDAFFTCSPEHYSNTFKDLGVLTSYIPFPKDISDDIILRDPKEILGEFGYRTEGEFHICNIGLWTPGKNQGYALQIAQRLYDKYGHTYQFHFIGNQAGNFQGYWAPLMEHLSPNVKVWGERADTATFLQMSDAMLFTSNWECAPIVLQEAAAYGVLTVAYDLEQYHGQVPMHGLVGDVERDADLLLRVLHSGQRHRLQPPSTGKWFAKQHSEYYSQLVANAPFRGGNPERGAKYTLKFDKHLKFTNQEEEPCNLEFYSESGALLYKADGIKKNHWAGPVNEWVEQYRVVAHWPTQSVERVLDLTGTTCIVEFSSSSLGDSLAFFDVVRAWKEEAGVEKVWLMTFKNFLFDWSWYEQFGIHRLNPGEKYPEHDHLIDIGVHMHNVGEGPAWIQHRNRQDWRGQYLGAIAADALGFKGEPETRPKLVVPDQSRPHDNKYIMIATQSTAQAKYWNNPDGWQAVVDWHIQEGYDVFVASHEQDGYMGNWYPKGVKRLPEYSLEQVSRWMLHAEYFIGISSGLSWLAWANGTPVVMISGFTPEECETRDKTLRIINKQVCNSCWKWDHFDKGDWYWCPKWKGTDRQFECSKQIFAKDVIKPIIEWKSNGYK